MNNSTRNPNSVAATARNQVVFAAPAVSLLAYWLGSKGLPPEILAAVTALAMAVITVVGTLARNIAESKGWTKYLG